MKKVILLHILLAVLWNSVTVVAQDIPKRELRGVWIATVWGIDWPSKAGCGPKVSERQRRELAELLDRCKRMNLTTVYFQVR
ncbi:MAG: hypothetical protein K2H05_07605, partial [Duncaniella sp.]|nr:hypothetical protein [Duncaniella sp.]